MLKAFNSICGFIRFAILLLIAVWGFKVLMTIHREFDSAIPEYQTVHYAKPEYRPQLDTVIKWIEKITQEQVDPIIVYDTVYYDEPSYKHLIRSIRSDGRQFTIQTQICGTVIGREHIYPYMRRYQIVATSTGLNVIWYKDFFRWTGLSLAVRGGRKSADEVWCGLVKSGLEYVLWRVRGEMYISTDGSVGFIVEKRLW